MQNNPMNMFNNINNNLFQQMMNQNIMNQPQVPQRQEIFLRFDSYGHKLIIPCFTDEKISEVIKRYENRANIDSNIDHFKYIYNGRPLDPNKIVGESEVLNGSEIIVLDPKNIMGG